jgi:hypothetical protein
MEDLRYPVGRFEMPTVVAPAERERLIAGVEALPRALAEVVAGLSAQQLDSPYRPEGWTLRQVVHHVPDSHMNAYVRFRLALTEAQPTIKPYDEAAWAELPDARLGPIDVSLDLLAALHKRWVTLMRALSPGEWRRTFIHPERGALSLDQTLAMYEWHGRHHLAHVQRCRERNGWRG